jgi:hypothetical protein
MTELRYEVLVSDGVPAIGTSGCQADLVAGERRVTVGIRATPAD